MEHEVVRKWMCMGNLGVDGVPGDGDLGEYGSPSGR